MYFQEGGDGGFLGIIAALAAFLGGLFGFFSDDAGWLKATFKKLGDLLNDSFHRIIDFLSLLWEDITDLIARAVKELKQLATDLGDFLGTLLRALHKLRDWLDLVYTKYLRPLLLLIQHIRQVLLYLRLFHIAFADKLDKYLAQLQIDIQRPFLLLRQTVNGVIDVLQLILDPRGIFMSGPLLWAIWRDLGQLAGMAHQVGMLGASSSPAATRGYYVASTGSSNVKTLASINAKGIFDPYQVSQKEAMDAALRAHV